MESELRKGNGQTGQNSDIQSHRSGVECGVGRGVHVGGRQDGTNSESGGAQGGNGNNTNRPHQDGQRTRGRSQNCHDGGRSA